MRLLLIEDDPMIGRAVRAGMVQAGFAVDWVTDGRDAELSLGTGVYDLAILDLGLPRGDGMLLLGKLRADGNELPVLIASARDTVRDRIAGLEAGADDYVLKPFDLDELIARVRALLRRHAGSGNPLLRQGDLVIDSVHKEVTKANLPVDLSPREYSVLEALMQKPGAVLSRERLEEAVYGWGEEVASNAIEVHVHHLRRKLGAEVIKNVARSGLPNGQRLMRSIRRTLLLWVMAALLLGALVVSAAAYFTTLEEINETLDGDLRHVAVSLARYQNVNAPHGQPRGLEAAEGNNDLDGSEIATSTWDTKGNLVYTSTPQVRIPFINRNGLTRVNVNEEGWIVYAIQHRDGFAQAAQRIESRRTIAREAAARTLPPMLLLAMGIGALLIYGLRYGLRPLDLAAQDVAGRSAKSLKPIESDYLPTEIAPMVGAINGLMARLNESLTAQRRFLSDAAHELRSPITALRLQLQVLERSADAAAIEAAKNELRQGVARAQRLVEQLLQFARTEPEAVTAPLVPTDLNQVVREVVGAQNLRAEIWKLDLGASVSEPVVALSEASQLTILLNNLVENAMRYTPSGGVVDVGAEMRDGHPVLFVRDTGPGIAKDDRERVFDRFYRGEQLAPSQRAIVGSGLGLAIVKAIADHHGAVVELLDRIDGPGLEVRVAFPAMGEAEKA